MNIRNRNLHGDVTQGHYGRPESAIRWGLVMALTCALLLAWMASGAGSGVPTASAASLEIVSVTLSPPIGGVPWTDPDDDGFSTDGTQATVPPGGLINVSIKENNGTWKATEWVFARSDGTGSGTFECVELPTPFIGNKDLNPRPANFTITAPNGPNALGSYDLTIIVHPNANCQGTNVDSFTLLGAFGVYNPLAAADTYIVAEDTVLDVLAVDGVLFNDTDATNQPLTAVLETGPANGDLTLNTLNADGSFTYTPDAGFEGVDSFTYKANNGTSDSNIATVSITVVGVNDAPVAGNDVASTGEDIPLFGYDLLINDTDTDGTLDPDSVVLDLIGVLGAVTDNGGGTIDYYPPADYYGTDTFAYTVKDDDGATSNSATVTITINALNDTPLAEPDPNSTMEDTLVSSSVSVLDNDALGDLPTTVTSYDLFSVQGGTVFMDPDGNYTYTPATNFNGTDTFEYTIKDLDLEPSTATVTIAVTAVNDAPVITSTPVTIATEDAPYTYNLAATDPDVGDALTFSLDVFPIGMTIEPISGLIFWTPTNAQVSPPTHSVTVRVTDDAAVPTFATQSFTIAVAAAADDDNDGVSNDLDLCPNTPAGEPVDADGCSASQLDDDNDGVSNDLDLCPNTPAGEPVDADGCSASQLDGENDAPAITSTAVTTATDGVPYSYDVAANDPNLGDTLTFSLDLAPASMTINVGSGLISWTPTNAQVSPPTHSVTVRVTDLALASAAQSFTITVNPLNDVPVARDDVYSTDEDTPVTVDVLVNDDLGNEPDMVSFDATSVKGGTVTDNGDGTFTYAPDPNFNGSDAFTYTITDFDGEFSTATVAINVTAAITTLPSSNTSPSSSSSDDDDDDNYYPVADEPENDVEPATGSDPVEPASTPASDTTTIDTTTIDTTTIDTTAPETTITVSPAGFSSDAMPGFEFTSSESGSTFECRLDGGAFAACDTPLTYSAGVTDGSHTFEVRATDSLGNTDATPASYSWTIDATAPDTIITVKPTDPSNDAVPGFEFSSTEPDGGFECSLDGAAFAACSSPWTYFAGVSDGSHTFEVRATDSLGNTDATPASYTWTIDTKAPVTSTPTAVPSLTTAIGGGGSPEDGGSGVNPGLIGGLALGVLALLAFLILLAKRRRRQEDEA